MGGAAEADGGGGEKGLRPQPGNCHRGGGLRVPAPRPAHRGSPRPALMAPPLFFFFFAAASSPLRAGSAAPFCACVAAPGPLQGEGQSGGRESGAAPLPAASRRRGKREAQAANGGRGGDGRRRRSCSTACLGGRTATRRQRASLPSLRPGSLFFPLRRRAGSRKRRSFRTERSGPFARSPIFPDSPRFQTSSATQAPPGLGFPFGGSGDTETEPLLSLPFGPLPKLPSSLRPTCSGRR